MHFKLPLWITALETWPFPMNSTTNKPRFFGILDRDIFFSSNNWGFSLKVNLSSNVGTIPSKEILESKADLFE